MAGNEDSVRKCVDDIRKEKKKEFDPFKLLCNESEIRPQAWNDNNN